MCESQNQFGFEFDLSRFENMHTASATESFRTGSWVKCILGGEESN